MTDDSPRQVFGIIFVGPPGRFSVWTETPSGELMDRDAVERLGQLAVRAGAADYRVFALMPSGQPEAPGPGRPETPIGAFEALLNAHAGMPPSSGKGPSAREEPGATEGDRD